MGYNGNVRFGGVEKWRNTTKYGHPNGENNDQKWECG
jgi:hypothetical protein